MQYKDLEKLVKLIDESGFDEFEYQTKTEKVRLKKTPTVSGGTAVTYAAPMQMPAMAATAAPATTAPAAAGAAPRAESSNTKKITSPFVGTFYEAPAPDAPKYTDVGRSFKKGDVLCIVEAMKIMNEIEAEISGKVVAVLVKSGQPVQYGQPLFEVEAL